MQANLSMTLNGRVTELVIDASDMLVDVIREKLGLIGTKIGCREGECGACTILIDGDPINACLVPALKAQGRTIATIEGLGTPEDPHPIQVAFAEQGAIQCGYCTPGFVMMGITLLENNADPIYEDIQEAMAGNFCRCGAYKRIVQAIQKVSRQNRE